jgi:hypothetical protein
MDIIKFKSGEEYPISFPFEAMVDLMGDDGILDYLNKYNSLKHQIQVLGAGLKYGHLRDGKQFSATDKQLREWAKENPRQLKEVFQAYDQEVAVFLKVYFSQDPDEVQEELTEEEIKENKKRVKP